MSVPKAGQQARELRVQLLVKIRNN